MQNRGQYPGRLIPLWHLLKHISGSLRSHVLEYPC